VVAGTSARAAHAQGRLLARPKENAVDGQPGSFEIGLERERDGILYVPKSYDPDRPAPFVLALHGAGGSGRNGLQPLLPLADRFGFILLSPDARLSTWDIIHDEYGPDVAYIDRALEKAFSRFSVDARHVVVEGFSDGASYALSLGIANGDLFSHVIAFSPGLMAPAVQIGKPRIFISHGANDPTLHIDRTSRTIVPRLERAGYNVTYEEFAGGHAVPRQIAEQAVDWFMTS